jgi:deoxyribodipyrimidine photo-lyase
MPEYDRALVWFRRDLRDFDHAALYHALEYAREVVCVFIFDREILDQLSDPADRRVEFIHASVAELQQVLEVRGGGLIVRHGIAREVIVQQAQEAGADASISIMTTTPSRSNATPRWRTSSDPTASRFTTTRTT